MLHNGYFCVPINNLELCSGMQLSYLETVCFSQGLLSTPKAGSERRRAACSLGVVFLRCQGGRPCPRDSELPARGEQALFLPRMHSGWDLAPFLVGVPSLAMRSCSHAHIDQHSPNPRRRVCPCRFLGLPRGGCPLSGARPVTPLPSLSDPPRGSPAG